MLIGGRVPRARESSGGGGGGRRVGKLRRGRAAPEGSWQRRALWKLALPMGPPPAKDDDSREQVQRRRINEASSAGIAGGFPPLPGEEANVCLISTACFVTSGRGAGREERR